MIQHKYPSWIRYAVIIISVIALFASSLLPSAPEEPLQLDDRSAYYQHDRHYQSVVGSLHHYVVKIHKFVTWKILFMLYLLLLLARSAVPRFRFRVPYLILHRRLLLRPLKYTSRFVFAD
ncbi:hypothetical protein M5W83_24025 [Paenibacillus thiaminolyticus]|uniref:Uncharacterized protein n=1 Tax=Paenibacillus thiaminolyticus TaxID=49283 RepID=A0AAP9DT41_PANTH|nr:hypothetical protein [Paenibacillus thiaminolyticus]MCY9536459.1 hypothetical protein [Paenibacillus thiaminolyticus]MCY9601471.1 hypothetical protein [Paenibacillus thiaminolyticus]MCY9610219.1 hypothetical protein [Paenibacillus thiaminolyticus]MCY9616499.1 hypothetical protein [Paenibacillus thiaminolyticus]MCY9616890.1 hypothetical protein [Paenibacillus thiaminolyticus]